MQEGWKCPVCARVFAPWVSQCGYCPGVIATTTTNVPPATPYRQVTVGDPPFMGSGGVSGELIPNVRVYLAGREV